MFRSRGLRLRLIQSCRYLCFTASLSGCEEKLQQEPIDSVSWALSGNLPLADDTFVNSIHPDNNNGASDSIYTGVSGQGGVMRGLVRFAMPSGLQGRVTVSNVKLSMTTRALGSGTAGPALIQRLQVVTEAWVQGNGVGDVSTLNTVGQVCGSSVSGVTWLQSDCIGAPGSGSIWSTPGGAVSASMSGQVTTPGVVNTIVVWDSAVGGNALMNTDAQNWIDTPSNNNGWRISSSDEVTPSFAQRFYASEAGVGNAPSLTIAYDCKAGFESLGSDCTSCTTAAKAKCVTLQGNSCIDSGAQSTTYICNCSNPAYKAGVDVDGAAACLACPTGTASTGGTFPTCIDIPDSGGVGGSASGGSSSDGGSSNVAGSIGIGGTSSIAGSSSAGGSASIGGNTLGGASATGGTPNQTGTGGSNPAGGNTILGDSTGGVTGLSSNSTSSGGTVDGGGCACRVGGPSRPARLPALVVIAGLLGALSIRRSSECPNAWVK